MFHADDTPPAIRKKALKEFYLAKKFEEEQALAHVEDPASRAQLAADMERARFAMVRIHLPLSPGQLQAVWREQDHGVRGGGRGVLRRRPTTHRRSSTTCTTSMEAEGSTSRRCASC